MGTIALTETANISSLPNKTKIRTWAHLVAADASGAPWDVREFRSLQVQIKGTWNTGTLTIQGSDNNANYLTLKDTTTLAAISYAADPTALIVIFECPNYVKPVLAGAGTDDITVTITGRT